MNHVTCPLCGSDDAKTVAEIADYVEKFRNVICLRCALVYANPQPTPAELEAYYAGQFIQGRHQIASVDEARERARKKGSQAKYSVEGLRDGLTPSSRALEIGCSYGFLLNALKQATGASVEGVEPSDVSGRFAEAEFNFPVFHGSVEAYLASPVTEGYDLIIISHVLEHLADPVRVLKELRKRLKPGGRLYVCVPDVTHLQEPPETFFQVPHLTSFSPWSLSFALWQAGWKPIRWSRKLRAPKSGMECYAVPSHDPRPMVSSLESRIGQDPKEVVSALVSIRRKYGALRWAKKQAARVVPTAALEHASLRLRRRLRRSQDR